MNVDNEINRHEPYKIADIRSIHFDLDFEESISDLPECIICRLTDLEDYYEDISKNTYCACNFYYHDSCYEEWIQYKKVNKCLICEKDISTNYIIEEPLSPRARCRLTRAEIILLRQLRIRDRPIGCDDVFCNIICCRFPFHSHQNSCLTWTQINESFLNKCFAVTITCVGVIGIIILVYILLTAPWVLTRSHT